MELRLITSCLFLAGCNRFCLQGVIITMKINVANVYQFTVVLNVRMTRCAILLFVFTRKQKRNRNLLVNFSYAYSFSRYFFRFSFKLFYNVLVNGNSLQQEKNFAYWPILDFNWMKKIYDLWHTNYWKVESQKNRLEFWEPYSAEKSSEMLSIIIVLLNKHSFTLQSS